MSFKYEKALVPQFAPRTELSESYGFMLYRWASRNNLVPLWRRTDSAIWREEDPGTFTPGHPDCVEK